MTSPLREHLASFTPSMVNLEHVAAAAIALANGGHWFTTLEARGIVVSVAETVETLQLGDFLAPNLDPWAEL